MTQDEPDTRQRKPRRVLSGVVTSAHKTPKTITVNVRYLVRQAKYGKYVRRSVRVHAHDEKAAAQVGDRVEVMECRPVSKTKTWRLVRVTGTAG